MPSILIVDDEEEALETTRWAFEAVGYKVYTAASGEDALLALKNFKPEVLLIDYKLPKMSGIELLREARNLGVKVPAIMITGLTHESETIEEECRMLGTYAFLQKPLRMGEVLKTVGESIGQTSRH